MKVRSRTAASIRARKEASSGGRSLREASSELGSVAKSRPWALKAMPFVRALPSPRLEPTTLRSLPSFVMRTTARSNMAVT